MLLELGYELCLCHRRDYFAQDISRVRLLIKKWLYMFCESQQFLKIYPRSCIANFGNHLVITKAGTIARQR